MPWYRRRRLWISVAILLSLYAVTCAYLYASMLQDPGAFGDVMAGVPMPAMMVLPFEPMWLSARAGSLQPGDLAPDFALSTVDHSATVRLSEFRGVRPVVLVFGSYT